MRQSTLIAAAIAFAAMPCRSELVRPNVRIAFNPGGSLSIRDHLTSSDPTAASNRTSTAKTINTTSETDLVVSELKTLTNFSSHGAPKVTDSLDPVKDWESNQHYNLDYWRRTKESLRDSDAVIFYRDFVVEYTSLDPHECKAKDLSLTQCFHWVYLGNQNFACTLDNTYLCGNPTPQTVMTHISSHWTDLSSKELVTMGRQVFLISEVLQSMMALDHRFFRLASVMETSSLAQVTDLVKAFTPQQDGVRVRKCEIAQKMLKISTDIAVMLFNDAASFFFAEASGALIKIMVELALPKKGIDAIKHSIGTAMPNMFPDKLNKNADPNNLARMIGGTVKLTYAFDEYFSIKGRAQQGMEGKHHASDSSQDQTQWEAYGYRNSSARLDLFMRTAKGMCGNNFGVVMDDNIAHESKLKAFIVDYVTDLRGVLDANFRQQFRVLEPQAEIVYMGPHLAKFMAVGKMSRDEIFNQDLKQMELSVKKSLIEVIASRLLAGSRAYMKCEVRDDAQQLCQNEIDHPSNNASHSSRWCPPEGDMRCQMARWTKQSKRNHEDYVPGLLNGGFTRYNMTPEILMSSSLSNFKRERASALNWDDMMTDVKEPHHMLHLPVCISNVHTIEEIMPPSFTDDLKWRKGFPFQCGDKFSNETRPFMEAANIHPADEPTLYSATLPKYLSRMLLPANRYMLLCRLGARWPSWSRTHKQVDTMDWLISNSTDHQCVPFHESAQDMTEWEMNYHFCTADMMKYTLSHEHAWIIGHNPPAKSHKRLCRSWLKAQSPIVKQMGSPAVIRKYTKHLAELQAMKTIDADGSELPDTFEAYDFPFNATEQYIEPESALRRRGIGGIPLYA